MFSLKKQFKGLKASVKSAFAGVDYRKIAMCLVFMVIGTVSMYAQGAGAFESAVTEIGKYQDLVKNLCYAIAGCIVFVGALNVGNKMWNGDQDVKKTIMLTLGGAIAMVALSEALPLFFK